MANISSAYGTVTINTGDLNDLATFLYLQQKSNQNAYYDTTLKLEYDKINTLEKIQEYVNNYHHKIEDQCYISLSFTALGRWTFANNTEWFFESVFEQTDTLVDTIKTKAFNATFDFLEEEGGVGFIADSSIDIEWEPSKQKQYTLDDQTIEYDYTAENLIKFDFYEPGNVWDSDYILKHPQYFVDALKEIKDDEIINVNSSAILENLSAFLTEVQKENNNCIYLELEEWLEYECPDAFKLSVEQA